VLCSQYGRTINGTHSAYSRLYVRCHSRSSPHTRLPLTYQLLRIGIRRRYLSYRYRRGTAVRRRITLNRKWYSIEIISGNRLSPR
jgi:hypothetical protein